MTTGHKKRALGWDPGKWNTAYAVYGPKGLEDTGVTDGTMDDVLNLDAFAERAERIIDWYDPDLCAVERYTLRGRGKGFIGNMEQVNLMIGTIAQACRTRNIPFRLVAAHVHKTWAKRSGGAKKGKDGKLDMTTCSEFQHLETDHEADAANLAKYILTKEG